MMQTILQTSVMMPAIRELLKSVDLNAMTGALSQAVRSVDPAKVDPVPVAPVKTAVRIPELQQDGHGAKAEGAH
jgi:hypothetical protein